MVFVEDLVRCDLSAVSAARLGRSSQETVWDACKVRRRSVHVEVERGICATVLWRKIFSCTPAHDLDGVVQGPYL